MKIVLTYGTFDLFHVGHVRLLERLSKLGEKLYVGISSDEFNALKGKTSFFSYEERAEIVAACKYVDFVFPENEWEQKLRDIKNYNVSIFAMGGDWEGKFDYLSDVCEVVYLPRTEDVSTTAIKSQLSTLSLNQLDDVEKHLHSIIKIVKSISST